MKEVHKVYGPTRFARSGVLVAGAAAAFSRATVYLPEAHRPSIEYLSPVEAWMPLQWWAWVWATVGVMLVVSLFVRRMSITSMSLLTGLFTLWGASYVWAWMFSEVQRPWPTGVLFLMGAVFAGALAAMMERGER